jgi:hypothetical protein
VSLLVRANACGLSGGLPRAVARNENVLESIILCGNRGVRLKSTNDMRRINMRFGFMAETRTAQLFVMHARKRQQR